MTIGTNSVVAFHYALTNDAGETLDSSNGRDPLSFLFGHGGIIPGLEAEFEGRSVGDKFDATIDPEHAYGVKDDTLVQEVPLSALSAIADLAVGMQLQSQTPEGQVQVLTVIAIGAETATLDANHPLAGQRLHFEVSIESARDATEDEISHGHVH